MNYTIEQSILLNAKQLIEDIPNRISLYVGLTQYDEKLNIKYRLTNHWVINAWGVSRGTYYKYLKHPLTIPFEKVEEIIKLLAQYEQNLKI